MSIYKTYSNEQIENLFSQFLISSWSFSKISEFSRNEKAFEMSYIYGIRSKSSASTVAGQAYHHALDVFFTALKKGETLDLVELESLVYEYIDTVEANKWKLQKTTPTIAECIAKTSKISKQLVHNFYKEKGTYISSELGLYSQNLWYAALSSISRGKKVIFPVPYSKQKTIPYIMQMLEEGHFAPVIDREYALEDISKADEYVLTGEKTGNVIINL